MQQLSLKFSLCFLLGSISCEHEKRIGSLDPSELSFVKMHMES